MSATVTVDRERLLDLMREAYSVLEVFDILAGVTPTTLTSELGRHLEEMQYEVFGAIQSNATGETIGPHAEMWAASDAEAKRFLRDLGSEAVAS
jgi:hypothetical protein